MYTTPRIALAMFIIPFVGVVRGLWGSSLGMFKWHFQTVCFVINKFEPLQIAVRVVTPITCASTLKTLTTRIN